jgi:hypothetical protein
LKIELFGSSSIWLHVITPLAQQSTIVIVPAVSGGYRGSGPAASAEMFRLTELRIILFPAGGIHGCSARPECEFMKRKCRYCKLEFPASQAHCVHCARFAGYPNVFAAAAPKERAALRRNHERALRDASKRGASSVAQRFEQEVLRARVAIWRPLGEVLRLASKDNQLYTTYYRLADAGVQVPEGDEWDSLRTEADVAVFRGYHREIRFAALALDDRRLSNYGVCMMVLREEMIAHRATLFVENTAVRVKRSAGTREPGADLPPGLRATWKARGRLALAKVADRLTPSTDSHEFPVLLLAEGADSSLDQFVEVHVYGPMTIRTVARLVIHDPRYAEAARLQGIEEMLRRYNVTLDAP